MNPKSLARAFALLSLVSTCHACHLWTDEFNQDDTFNIRDFINRQVFATGSNLVAPVGFLTNAVNPPQPTNYHEQIQGHKLLIAGDSLIGTYDPNPLLNTYGLSLVALNRNFNGVTAANFAAGVVTQCGKLSLILDAMTNAAPGTYGYAGLTVGGNTIAASTTVGFSIRFVEDNSFGFGNFIQFYDGQTLIQNLIPNPAGAGSMNVELEFSDSDNNPWDGVGATTIKVYVNGTQVGSTFTKGGGGFSNNFITIEGSDDQVTHNLGIHTVDTITITAGVSLTVHTGQTITQSTSLTLDCLVIEDGGTFILGSPGPAPSAPILTASTDNPPSIVPGSTPTQTAVVVSPPSPIPATESVSLAGGQGNYGGLLESGNAKPGVASFMVSRNGRFTSSIRYEDRRYRLSGKFDKLGHFAGLARSQGCAPLAVALSLDAAELTGMISDGGRQTAFAAARAAFTAKTNPNLPAGRYFLELLPRATAAPSLPIASGQLRVQSSGSVRLVGKLLDGTPFSLGGTSAMIPLPK